MSDVPQLRPEPEPYLTRREIAERLHIGLTKLDELVKEGLPSHTWGLRIRRFRFGEVESWLRAREQSR